MFFNGNQKAKKQYRQRVVVFLFFIDNVSNEATAVTFDKTK